MHHGPKRHIAHLLEKMVSCLTMGGGGDNDTVSLPSQKVYDHNRLSSSWTCLKPPLNMPSKAASNV